MATHQQNLMLLTLAYPPASGGASIYTQLLTKGLLQQDFRGKIVVLAEAYPRLPQQEILLNQRLYLWRIFPFRSELSRKDIQRYFKYLYLNVKFLNIFNLITKFEITHLIVHCHYYYRPSILPLLIRWLKMTTSIKLILDVRDPKLSKETFSQIYLFDNIICSSQNVYQHLTQDQQLIPKLRRIPIPFQLNSNLGHLSRETITSFHLENQPYLFSASGILQEKNLNFMLKTMAEIRLLDPHLILVIVGVNKDWNSVCDLAVQKGLIKYLGVVSHEMIFCLAKQAEMVINLSKIESPSRYILEAIAVGTKVLLPANVPEFMDADPDKVVRFDDPQKVAKQIINLLHNKHYKLNYNLKTHSLDQIIPQYLKLLS